MISLNGRLGLALVGLLVAAGCGGGGHRSASNDDAGLMLAMAWPQTSRLVPNAANSVVAVVTAKGREVARGLFVRPTDGSFAATQLELKRLPAGPATVTLTAYPSTDGSGVPQATGTATTTLLKGQMAQTGASMASTVATLSIAGASEIPAGETAPLTVEARDAQGRAVLLDTNFRETLEWSSDAAAVATVDAEGVVTGVALGTANVAASMVVDDAGTRKTATAPLAVSAARTLVSVSCDRVGVPGNPYVLNVPSVPVTLTGTYSDGGTRDLTTLATWTATNPTSTVEVVGRNLVRGTMIGTTGVVSWTFGAFSGDIHVRIQ